MYIHSRSRKYTVYTAHESVRRSSRRCVCNATSRRTCRWGEQLVLLPPCHLDSSAGATGGFLSHAGTPRALIHF